MLDPNLISARGASKRLQSISEYLQTDTQDGIRLPNAQQQKARTGHVYGG